MSFSVINNLSTSSSEGQINFGALQIDTENSATGVKNNSNCNVRTLMNIGFVNYKLKNSIFRIF